MAAPVGKTTALNFQVQFTLREHTRSVCVVKFSPDGKLLASGSADKSVIVWNPFDGTMICKLEGMHKTGINDLAWSPCSKYIISVADDTYMCLWDVTAKCCIRVLRGHQNYVFCVNYNDAGNVIVSGSFDETIRLWDAKTGVCIKVINAHSDPVTAVEFNSDGSMIISASYDGLCRLWDSATGQCLKTIYMEKTAPVSFARFSPNGSFILVGYLDSTLRLWKISLGNPQVVVSYRGHKNEKHCVSCQCSKISQHIVSGSEDHCVYVWDVSSKTHLHKLTGHTDAVLTVAWHPKEPLLASGGMEKDRTVKIWRHVDPSPPQSQ